MTSLPAGWATATLGELCSVITDGTHQTPKYVKQGVRFLSTANIHPFRSGFDFSNYERFISTGDHAVLTKRHRPERGDILISKCGTIGRAKEVDVDYPFSIFVGLALLKPMRGVFGTKFLEYLLNNQTITRRLEELSPGSTRLTLTLTAIKSLRIPVPPLQEQCRIVAKLEGLLGKVDACQKRLERIPLILKRFRQSVLAAACSGRLTEDWRKENPARLIFPPTCLASDEADNFIEGIEIPRSWRTTKLNNVSDIRGGIQKTPLREPRKNKFPYLRVANVYRGRLHLDEIKYFELERGELERWALKTGDLLIVEGNGSPTEIGRCAIWHGEIPNCVHQNHIIRCRLSQGIEGEFVLSFLNSNLGIGEMMTLSSSTSGLHTLSVAKVGNITIPLAPPQEQVEIVRRIKTLFGLADQIETRHNAAKASVDQLTQSILAKAFRGELVPQDPKDETASGFLERTHAKQSRSLETRRR